MEHYIREYYNLAREISEKYESGELNDDLDESRAGGFWDLAMEIAEMQLPRDREITDEDLGTRDEVASIIYRVILGAINK